MQKLDENIVNMYFTDASIPVVPLYQYQKPHFSLEINF